MDNHTPLTRSQKIEALVAVIVKAVPDIIEKCGCGKCDYCELFPEGEPSGIILEDVLRTFEKKRRKTFGAASLSNTIANGKERDRRLLELLKRWQLGLFLQDQSDETIHFLHSLLPSSL